MTAFSYTAKLQDGRRVTGVLEAPSQKALLEALYRQGLVVIAVKTVKLGQKTTGRVCLDHLAAFTRQLATLVDAGIPIVSGLDAVADQQESRTLRDAVIKIRDSVEGGTSLTSAIGMHSNIFSTLFVSLIRAGEASGHLAEILQRLATYLEKSAALQRKIKSACVYPAIVIGMAVLITSFLILRVIPTFKEIFRTLGVPLPLPTRILLAVSDFAQHFFFPGLVVVIVGIVLLRRAIKTPKGQLLYHRLLLKLVLIGPIVRKVAIAKFSRTLATLVKSGVPILDGLEIVAGTSGNQVVANAVLKVKDSIREGENISAPLLASGVFPLLVVRMISVGEQTGRLDEMLVKIAEAYEDQVDAAINGLTSAIEPIIIGVLGIVIGSIVLSIFLPIFKLTEVLSK